MEEKDFIKELFQEKLAQHQSPVSPELWTSVSSSISSGSAVVSSGLSLLTKSIIGGLSAAAVIGSVWFMNQPASTSTKKPINTAKRPIEKTETTTTKIPETSNNKIKTEFHLNPSPIPLESSVNEGPSFGPGITLPTEREALTALPIQPTEIVRADHNQTGIIPTTPIVINALESSEAPISISQEQKIRLPNIFTPNGDGQNDVFNIDLTEYQFQDFSLVILDLTNHIMFQSSDPSESWNGKKPDGEMCLTGNYVYYLTGKTIEGKTISKYSTLRIQY
jgi:gliding motility-associated-like protein